MCNFEIYLEEALNQLTCNASKEYQSKYITYTYSVNQVMDNIDYFKICQKDGLSAYKALLFFNDYLNDEQNEF